MASGQRSRLAALLTVGALVMSSCVAGAETEPSSPPAIVEPPVTTTAPATTTTEMPTTTTASTTTTTTPSTTSSSLPELPDTIDPDDVQVPEGDGPFPAVVLVHGGGWVAGDPSAIGSLADYLTDNGFLTVNTSYQLASSDPGFPDAIDDIACAVSFAAVHPESDGTVAVVGHSAGAHLASVVALNGDEYGDGCPIDGPRVPQRLVGLAGPYDVDRLGLVMLPFFGGGPDVEPEAWEAGNPLRLTTENTELSSLIMYGEDDVLVDARFALDFHEALIESGSSSTLERVEGARHMELREPDTVGDLIVTWLDR